MTQLGKRSVHLTQLGGPTRPLFLSLCEADSLCIEWVESNSPIRFCYTLINDADASITELVEESDNVEPGAEERLIKKFDSLLEGEKSSFDFLIISGTKALGFSDKVIPLMVRKAKERGLKIILDVKGKDLIESLKYKPDIIKPNLYEFASTFAPDLIKNNDLTGDEDAVKEQIKAAMLDTCKKYGCRVILTRGSRKTWAADEKYFFETDFTAIKPVNPIGCGDAFTAGLASALGDGAGFKEAITEGLRCGALCAGLIKPGVIK